MIEIGDIVVSRAVLENYFYCDYDKCKGICCVEGESGAPLKGKEADLLRHRLARVSHLLSPEALEVIREQGVSYRDKAGEEVTSIVSGKDCVFTTYSPDGGCLCALEKERITNPNDRETFVKPISCRLYPIRVRQYRKFTMLNFDEWDICRDARILGKEKGVRVFEFLRQPLVETFGLQFYKELEIAADYLQQHS